MSSPTTRHRIDTDATTHASMLAYANAHGLSLPDLLRRMWHLWHDLEQAREHGVLPPVPRRPPSEQASSTE